MRMGWDEGEERRAKEEVKKGTFSLEKEKKFLEKKDLKIRNSILIERTAIKLKFNFNHFEFLLLILFRFFGLFFSFLFFSFLFFSSFFSSFQKSKTKSHSNCITSFNSILKRVKNEKGKEKEKEKEKREKEERRRRREGERYI